MREHNNYWYLIEIYRSANPQLAFWGWTASLDAPPVNMGA